MFVHALCVRVQELHIVIKAKNISGAVSLNDQKRKQLSVAI